MWKIQRILHNSRFAPPRAASDRGRTTGWTPPKFDDALMPACVMRRRYRQASRVRNPEQPSTAWRNTFTAETLQALSPPAPRHSGSPTGRICKPVRTADRAQFHPRPANGIRPGQAGVFESPLPENRWQVCAKHPNCGILPSLNARRGAEVDVWAALRAETRCRLQWLAFSRTPPEHAG